LKNQLDSPLVSTSACDALIGEKNKFITILIEESATSHKSHRASVASCCQGQEMLIGLCGGICSGKHAIADYLIEHQEFQLLELNNKKYPRITDDPEDDLRLQASELSNKRNSEFLFDSVESLLDFATKRWRERWVTTDIWDAATIDRFLQRPFFLLVSVDAPVSLRWKRFTDR
jgi:dephospho-CoA kinase